MLIRQGCVWRGYWGWPGSDTLAVNSIEFRCALRSYRVDALCVHCVSRCVHCARDVSIMCVVLRSICDITASKVALYSYCLVSLCRALCSFQSSCSFVPLTSGPPPPAAPRPGPPARPLDRCVPADCPPAAPVHAPSLAAQVQYVIMIVFSASHDYRREHRLGSSFHTKLCATV